MNMRLATALLAAAVCMPSWAASDLKEGTFTFQTFSVPGTPSTGNVLGVEDINDQLTAVGYTTATSVFTFGWERLANGKIIDINEPSAVSPYQNTTVLGVNNLGVVVGYFYDTQAEIYSGFFFYNGNYQIYNVPNLVAGSDTAIYGVNDLGVFCGFYQQPPAYVVVPFCNAFGHLDTNFSIPGAASVYPFAINDLGAVVGTWYDSSGMAHGFIRNVLGKISTFDVPGAGYTGSVAFGLNNLGWISGHFWDANDYEHGYILSPQGVFYQVDVPGAATNLPGEGTAGGGLNDDAVIAGHYDPADGGPERGYIAIPTGAIK
jgi:hypothetical protein